jgi:hypothetical protein
MVFKFDDPISFDASQVLLRGWIDLSAVWQAGFLQTQLQSLTTLAVQTFDATTVFKKGDKLRLRSNTGKTSYAFITAVAPGSITYTNPGNAFLPNPTLNASDFIQSIDLSRLSNPEGWPPFFYYNAVAAGSFTHAVTGVMWVRFNINESNVVAMWFHSADLTLPTARSSFQFGYPAGIVPTNLIGVGGSRCDAAAVANCIQLSSFINLPGVLADTQLATISVLKSDATNWNASSTHLLFGHVYIPI